MTTTTTVKKIFEKFGDVGVHESESFTTVITEIEGNHVNAVIHADAVNLHFVTGIDKILYVTRYYMKNKMFDWTVKVEDIEEILFGCFIKEIDARIERAMKSAVELISEAEHDDIASPKVEIVEGDIEISYENDREKISAFIGNHVGIEVQYGPHTGVCDEYTEEALEKYFWERICDVSNLLVEGFI